MATTAQLRRAPSRWMRPRLARYTASPSLAASLSTAPRDSGARTSSSHARRPRFHRPDEPPQDEPAPPILALPAAQYALHANEVHCFLGVNGSGKSRLLQQLQDAAAHAKPDPSSGRRVRLGTLSFDAHRAFVSEHGHKVVADVLGGIGSPEARDLIVRLGLFPVWDSYIRHLSTGEMRKVLLAVALLKVPRANVLILDQPFDGLDKAARRQLEWMLGQLTRGFTKLLVDTGGRNDAFAYKTQVLLVANRLEQVFPAILTHVVLTTKPMAREKTSGRVEIVPWQNPEQPDEMLARLRHFFHEQVAIEDGESAIHHTSPAVPDEKIEQLVKRLYSHSARRESVGVALEFREVSVAYGRRLLLEQVDFKRSRDAHWALLGPNGSGKSSLMRVLMQSQGHGQVAGEVVLNGDRIAVVSTDQHLEMLANEDHATRSARDWLTVSAEGDSEIVETAVQLLGIPHEILDRQFQELSQGEQKLVQIATAVAQRPDVLILDEITHGLDMWNRQRVLRVVNALGLHASASTHLILITHHEDEIVECFADVFEIHDQKLQRVVRN